MKLLMALVSGLIPHFGTECCMFMLNENEEVVVLTPFEAYEDGDELYYDGVVDIRSFRWFGYGFFPKAVGDFLDWNGDVI
jgi:hypothetical protein